MFKIQKIYFLSVALFVLNPMFPMTYYCITVQQRAIRAKEAEAESECLMPLVTKGKENVTVPSLIVVGARVSASLSRRS